MIIIGTGSRDWRSPIIIRAVFTQLLQEFGRTWTYYHGAAKGFDSYSDFVLRQMKFMTIESFPADWDKYGNDAGPIRNQLMIDTALTKVNARDILLVAMPLENSIGTYDCIARAEKLEISTRVYNQKGILI